MGIRRLVLDVLKPLEGPSLVELTAILGNLKGVNGVNISVVEIDKQTETVKLTIEGEEIQYDAILEELDKHGAVVHSIDEVAAGKKLVNSVKTKQG